MRGFRFAALALVLTFGLAPMPAHAGLIIYSLQQDQTAAAGGSVQETLTANNPSPSSATLVVDVNASQPVLPTVNPTLGVSCTNQPGTSHCQVSVSPQGALSVTWTWGPLASGAFNTTVSANDFTGPPTVLTGTTIVGPINTPPYLAFVKQPVATQTNTPFSVSVQLFDPNGNPLATDAPVTVQLANNPTAATLSGTTTKISVSGVTWFTDLSIDKVGSGYTLVASRTGVTAATSNPFNVTIPLAPVHLDETGLADGVPHLATFDGTTVNLPFDTLVAAGSDHSFGFPGDVVTGSAGTRYHTEELGGALNVGDGFTRTASYKKQYLLTTKSNCAGCAGLGIQITGGGWYDEGTSATVTAPLDLVLQNPSDRARFEYWNGDASGRENHASILMAGPRLAMANYILQHLVVVSAAGLPADATWRVNVNGAWYPGPYSDWIDDGSLLSLGASPVLSPQGRDGSTYYFTGFDPAPPSVVTAPFGTTALYSPIKSILGWGAATGAISPGGAKGAVNSLSKQFTNLEQAVDNGDVPAAQGAFQSLECHIDALAGNKISFNFSAILINYAEQNYRRMNAGPPPAGCP